MKIWEDKIHYSQCWEDPVILKDALYINPEDTVLSITSGGDNTLALLLENPQSIVTVDVNKSQNYLLELKMAAIKRLDYESFLGFLGIEETGDRLKQFETLQDSLSPGARAWWLSHKKLIQKGIVHCGKFEKYLALFRKVVLPLVHSQNSIKDLLNTKTLPSQQKFYSEKWNTWRWRALFRIFFSRAVMSKWGRSNLLFEHTATKNVGDYYLKRTKHFLMNKRIHGNYFLEYILKGEYESRTSIPPYLLEENFISLKNNLSKITAINSDLLSFLKEGKTDSYTKFNLSDVFESLSKPETDPIFKELVRVGQSGAVIVYWNNLVLRTFPKQLSNNIKCDNEKENYFHQKDQVFFYNNFNVNQIVK